MKTADTTMDVDPSNVTVTTSGGQPTNHSWSTSATIGIPSGSIHIDGEEQRTEISLFGDELVVEVTRQETMGSSYVEFAIHKMHTLSEEATGIMGK